MEQSFIFIQKYDFCVSLYVVQYVVL